MKLIYNETQTISALDALIKKIKKKNNRVDNLRL